MSAETMTLDELYRMYRADGGKKSFHEWKKNPDAYASLADADPKEVERSTKGLIAAINSTTGSRS